MTTLPCRRGTSRAIARKSAHRPARLGALALALALATPLVGHAGYSVSGNTIRWDADGWYQVQRPSTSSWDLCNSSSYPNGSCTVSNGTYTVINQNTNQRWENIVVPQSTGTQTGYTVSGNTIRWGTDGWYQVQRPSTGEFDLCNSSNNPSNSCTVANGIYTIINHTSQRRWDNVAVGGTTPPSGAGAQTSAKGPQPTGASDCGTRDTWDFLTTGTSPLASTFYGACNPGNGLVTRAWVSSDNPNAPGTRERWLGEATVNTGTPGKNFWIDWKNRGSSLPNKHAEFDIAIARDTAQYGQTQGYGVRKISEIFSEGRDLTLTARGGWIPSARTQQTVPVGKSHVQTIIWLAREQYAQSNACGGGVRQTIDITVADYMSDAQRKHFQDVKNGGHRWIGTDTTYLPGQVTLADGSRYDLFRRTPGGFCEIASYIAMRDLNGNANANRFSSNGGFATSSINARPFIERVIARGDATNQWYISAMGWEIAGASRDNADSTLGDSGGKFTFDCYSVPSLNGVGSGDGFTKCP